MQPNISYTARMKALANADEGRVLIRLHTDEINALERSLNLVPSVGEDAAGYRGYVGFSTLGPKQRSAAVRRIAIHDRAKANRMQGLMDDGVSMHQAFDCLLTTERERYDSCCPAPRCDPEYNSRLDAQRATLEFRTRSTRRLDAGKKPIEESPLFGGATQQSLF